MREMPTRLKTEPHPALRPVPPKCVLFGGFPSVGPRDGDFCIFFRVLSKNNYFDGIKRIFWESEAGRKRLLYRAKYHIISQLKFCQKVHFLTVSQIARPKKNPESALRAFFEVTQGFLKSAALGGGGGRDRLEAGWRPLLPFGGFLSIIGASDNSTEYGGVKKLHRLQGPPARNRPRPLQSARAGVTA
jgi:hypothetical protein